MVQNHLGCPPFLSPLPKLLSLHGHYRRGPTNNDYDVCLSTLATDGHIDMSNGSKREKRQTGPDSASKKEMSKRVAGVEWNTL